MNTHRHTDFNLSTFDSDIINVILSKENETLTLSSVVLIARVTSLIPNHNMVKVLSDSHFTIGSI